jgi:hypothetical protein
MTENPGAGVLVGQCRERLQEISILLKSVKEITPLGLVQLCSSDPAFGEGAWIETQLNPAYAETWRCVLFGDNPITRVKPERAGNRLRLVLEHFKLVDLSRLLVPTNLEQWLAWLNAVLDSLQERVRRDRLGLREKDLVYVGSAEDGVKKFRDMSKDPTTVYNTVFTRSEPGNRHLNRYVPILEQEQRKLLRSGNCEWIDIVLESERPRYSTFVASLTKEEAANHSYKIIDTTLPLFQCLAFREQEERGAAFVGWSFAGSPVWRVFFTDDWETVRYFLDYCKSLLAWTPPVKT